MYRLVASCLLFISLAGCASYPGKLIATSAIPDCPGKFRPVFTANWYTASIDVVGHHLSGLLLFKTMPDSSTRIVFTNEAGITYFDYAFSANGEFEVKQSLNQFNRKAVTQTLRKDLELILMQHPSFETPLSFNNEIWHPVHQAKETDYYITDAACNTLLRIEKTGKGKKKVVLHRTGQIEAAPDSVHLQHFTFAMQISLKKVSVAN